MVNKSASSGRKSRPLRRGRSPQARISGPRIPRQERARQTVAAILEAAAQLIAEDGYDATSTNRIAARAGVSIGSLYQYFPNKEAILVGLLEQHQRAVRPVIERSIETLRDPAIPLETALRDLFRCLVEAHSDSPRLNRALIEEVPRPPDVRRRERAENRSYVEQVAHLLARRSATRIGADPAAAHVFVHTITALSRWIVHEPPGGIDRDALIHQAVAMLAAYVQCP